MKTNPFITLPAAFALLLGASASAIEAPGDDAPPPTPPATAGSNKNADVKPAPQQAAKAESPFLGVVSANVPAVLAAHLNLQAGQGIVVQALLPDGPAAKSGLAVHDVITAVAGQPVNSLADLTKSVSAHQPGDKLKLEIIHQAKPTTLDVTLGSRPNDLAAAGDNQLEQLPLDGIPADFADRIRGAIRGNLGNLNLDLQPDAAAGDIMREMKERMAKALEGMNDPQDAKPHLNIQQGATIRLMDEQGSIELKSNDGSKEVAVRDKDNKIIWNGPWDTEQDKTAAPADVRQRVERLNLDTAFKGNGLRLQFRGGLEPPAPPAGN